MSAKTRLQQICFMVEDQAGVAPSQATLLAAAKAKLLAMNVNLNFDQEQYEREIYLSSLSGLNTIAGVVEANLSFSFELSGSALSPATGNLPVWGDIIRGCSVEQVAYKRGISAAAITPGANGGPMFEAGTILRNAGDSVRGRVVADFWTGQTVLRYVPTVGSQFVVGDTVTDLGPDGLLTSGSTLAFDGATSQAPTAGQAWVPATDTVITLSYASITGAGAVGDIYTGNNSGAVLTPLATVAAGPLTLVQFRIMDGVLTSGETLTNQSQTGTIVNVTAFAQLKCPTISFGVVQDGRFILVKGCRGNFSMAARIGQPDIITCNFKGSIAATPGNAAGIPSVSYESPVPPKFMGAVVKIGSHSASEPGKDTYTTEHTPRVTGFQFDYGAEVTLERDATSATGTVVAQHTGRRKATFSLDPVARPEATFPWLKKVQNGEHVRVRIQIGSTLKNAFILQLPAWKPEGPNSGDESGFLRDKLTGRCSGIRYFGQDGFEREFALAYCEAVHPTTPFPFF